MKALFRWAFQFARTKRNYTVLGAANIENMEINGVLAMDFELVESGMEFILLCIIFYWI